MSEHKKENLIKHGMTLTSFTSKYPANRREPMMIKMVPMRKRPVARAIALYGTLGGLLLN